MRPIAIAILVFGAALLVYCVLDRSVRSSGDPFNRKFGGYYYKTPAKLGAAAGAALVVGGLLLRRRPPQR